jgi:phage recombination protein Bet
MTVPTVVRSRLPMPQGQNHGTWRVLTEAIFPNARSAESVVLALEYCRARNLDVMKRPVNIVPMWDGTQRKYVETIWPSINEIQITAARTHEWAGLDMPLWGPDKTQTFTEDDGTTHEVTFPEWCAVTVYRHVCGQRCAFVEPAYWLEACARSKGAPNAMWRKRPRGQLSKVAKAMSLRAAFPEESAGPSSDEMEGQPTDDAIDTTTIEHASGAPAPSNLPEIKPAPKETDDLIDPETGEVIDSRIEPHTIDMNEGSTWAQFLEPLQRCILASRTIAEIDDWKLKNQALLIKLKDAKPQLFQLFEKNIEPKIIELTPQ